MKGSAAERFEELYRRIWGALNRPDDPDLGQHARQLLHHVPAEGAVSLTALAEHLALPKSTASVLIKELARRGFVHRARDSEDERRLAIALTDQGRARPAPRPPPHPHPPAPPPSPPTPQRHPALA